MMKSAPSPEIPDTLLPVQYFSGTARSDTPEKRLIFAVLLDAVVELQRGDTSAAGDAELWIRGETDDVPIRFGEACEALGLEAPTLARGLLSWRARSSAAPRVRGRPLPSRQRRVTPSEKG